MKKYSLLAIAICAFAIVVRAGIIAYDGFEDSALGAVNEQSGGLGFVSKWTAQGVSVVKPYGLSYSGGALSVGGGTTHLRTSVGSSAVVFARLIDTALLPTDGSDIYVSFLMRVSGSLATDGDPDYALIGFAEGASSTPAFGAIYTTVSGGTSNGFGLRHYGANVPGSVVAVADHTYLVVFKWSKSKLDGTAPQSYYRYMSLAVDPTSIAEPSSESWTIADSYKDNKNALTKYPYLVAYLQYASNQANRCEAEDAIQIDEIRIGTSWADVTGASTFGGLVPRPVVSVTDGAGEKTVTMTSAGEDIYYTTDGTTPSASNGTLYTAPFSLSQSATVRSVAVASGGATSAVVLTPCNFEAHWTGAGADDYWTTSDNWSPSGSPANKAIVFGAEDRTLANTVNSVVSQDMTVRSLCFTNNNFAPAVATANAYWHVVRIEEGKTLTVDGMNEDGYSMKLWAPQSSGKNMYVAAAFTGGGCLKVDSPESNILLQHNSNNNTANAYFDASGLGELSLKVSDLTLCHGKRTQGYFKLAAAGDGENTIVADSIYVGDCHSQDQGGGTVYLYLGKANEIKSDVLYVGAPPAGYVHNNGAVLRFADGLSAPTVKIRAKDGQGRADMKIGSHGESAMTPRSMSATADFTAGTVDARIGNLLVGNGTGYYWSNNTGAQSGTLAMSAGTFDVASATIARSLLAGSSKNVTAGASKGAVRVSGGEFSSVGNVVLGINEANALQGVEGTIDVTGGTLSVGGDMTLATRLGLATNVVANVNVSNGSLFVLGNLASGEAITNLENAVHVVNLQGNVNALGGVIAVTNVAGTSELRLESGTLALAGGKVYADTLVMTNAASTVAVELSDSLQTAEVGLAKFGGTLSVTLADGFIPSGRTVWHVVAGRSARTGKFETVDLPEGLKVSYTANGFDIATKGGFTLIVR